MASTLTKEYKLFQSKIADLATGTQGAVEELATRALAKALISSDKAEDAKNPHKGSSYVRASNLLQILLDRIQVNYHEFYTVCEIFRSIPSLKPMADMLNPSSSTAKNTPEVHSSSTTQEQVSLLGITNKKEVAGFLVQIAAEWEAIGLALDIPPDELNRIESDKDTVKSRLLEVIAAWLTGKGGDRTWRFLCKALREPLVGRSDIADKIEREH